MNDPVLSPSISPLMELLSEQFSQEGIRRIVGEQSPALDWKIWSEALHAPLADFLARPGKQFRSELVETSWRLAGGKGEFPYRLGLLVEILHAGSLIVDDIEDESPLRRGAPALHCQVGVPVALNTGNWLYFWAFALVEQVGLGPHVELAIHRWLSSTLLRCHYGQALDLTVRMAALRQDQVRDVVLNSTRLKTGCLMELSAALGAIAAGASREKVRSIADFGCELGVALQMLDDHGGLVSQQRCHKGHEDLVHGRPTWPWAWLSQTLSTERFGDLQRLAREVEGRTVHPERLAEAMRQELGRTGRARIRQHIRQVLRDLRLKVGASTAIGRIGAEIRRLEQSYG